MEQRYGNVTYAQHGEDLAVVAIFDLLNIEKPSYLDVGAHHPFNISNTALLYSRGARGVNVEANPDLMGSFYELRPGDLSLNIGVAPKSGTMTFYRTTQLSSTNTFEKKQVEWLLAESPYLKVVDTLEIEVVTLNDLVQKYCGGRFPNFLSIDAESLDVDIWEGVDFSHSRPDVICAEGWNDDAVRIAAALKRWDYVPYLRTWSNRIFLTEDAYRRVSF